MKVIVDLQKSYTGPGISMAFGVQAWGAGPGKEAAGMNSEIDLAKSEVKYSCIASLHSSWETHAS